LNTLNEINSQVSALPALSLRGLLDVIRAAEPGCLCDPELFTGPAGVDEEPPEDEAARVAVARQVCGSCPVRLACLAYALRTRPAAGVWAGCTAEEIRSLAVAASRPARPRRDAVLRGAAGKAVA
jgi:Transcription factor WhiB